MTTVRRSILSTAPGTNREAFASIDWGLFVAVGTIWGSSFLFMDIGLDAFAPGLITWLRVGLGAVVLLLFPRARAPIAADDWPRLVVLSLIWVGVPFTLFPIAQQWINSAVTGMLNGATPIATAVVATVLLRRLPRPIQLAGLALGLAGVVLIALPSIGEGTTQARGVVLVLAATTCYGFAINIAAPLQQRYGSLPVMTKMLLLAAVWTAPLGLVSLPSSSFAWPSALATAAVGMLGTGIAFVIMGTLVGRVGSTRSSFITYLIPVVALGLGVVFRSDRVTGLALAGVVLVIGGALLASRREG